MAAYHLVPHPDARRRDSSFVGAIALRRSASQLLLRFSIRDFVPRIRWHRPEEAGRFDELWKHSCFEAFVRGGDRDEYLEFNFAPARQWAAYSFDEYRTGMRRRDELEPRRIGWRLNDRVSIPYCALTAELELPPSFANVDWSLGFSNVIEEVDGTRSYWALAHAPGPPDFHNPACFIATLPAPEKP